MAIFNSYVSLPEGINNGTLTIWNLSMISMGFNCWVIHDFPINPPKITITSSMFDTHSLLACQETGIVFTSPGMRSAGMEWILGMVKRRSSKIEKLNWELIVKMEVTETLW